LSKCHCILALGLKLDKGGRASVVLFAIIFIQEGIEWPHSEGFHSVSFVYKTERIAPWLYE
jgi:hypothetical protein